MANPLMSFEQWVQANSISGLNSEELLALTQQRCKELHGYTTPPTILLIEPDPAHFLSGLMAACACRSPIFLCNPDWVEAEWQQVFDKVQPDLIWSRSANSSQPWLKVQSSLQKQPLRPPSHLSSLIMIPTGGTSGKIRFAMHTWETLSASVQGFQQYCIQHLQSDRIHSFCVLPLYHVSGLMQFVRSFVTQGRMIILPWRQLEAGAGQEIDPQIFCLSLVPTQLQRLLTNPRTGLWLSKFKMVLLGGAPAWAELLQQARANRICLAPTYGMTETASQVATLPPKAFLNGDSHSFQQNCAGEVLPHADITIRNSSGERLEVGQLGKVTIQADSLMLGYYPDPFETALYQPDDLGFLDAQGYLHIVGRDSSKIITGGENVFPTEVEAAILATQLVKEVCVLGIPDSTWGQIIVAVYVPQAPVISDEMLIHSLEERLSKFKHPKCWVAIAALPRNPQGKINHQQLREIIAERTGKSTTPARA